MSPLPGLGWGLLRWATAPRAWADTPPWTAVHGVPSPSPTLTLGRAGLLPSPPRGVSWASRGPRRRRLGSRCRHPPHCSACGVWPWLWGPACAVS